MSNPAAMTEFFDYACDGCGAAFCERVHLMNMALGNIDDEYCLDCLSGEYSRQPEAMANYCKQYVMARDCFKTPWEKFDASGCPKLADHTCHCQHEAPDEAPTV